MKFVGILEAIPCAAQVPKQVLSSRDPVHLDCHVNFILFGGVFLLLIWFVFALLLLAFVMLVPLWHG